MVANNDKAVFSEIKKGMIEARAGYLMYLMAVKSTVSLLSIRVCFPQPRITAKTWSAALMTKAAATMY